MAQVGKGQGPQPREQTSATPAAGSSAQGTAPAQQSMQRARGTGGSLAQPASTGLGTPFGLMRRFFEDIDELFGGFGFGGSPLARSRDLSLSGIWDPRVDVFERGDKLVVRADLPGVAKEDLRVDVMDDTLVLSGERRYEQERNEEGVYQAECSYGRFQRAIPLAAGIRPEDVDAHFDNGVLEVLLPKPAQQQTRGRTIDIKTGARSEAQAQAKIRH